MKKFLGISLASAMLFAGGYEFGLGAGRSQVVHAPISHFDSYNLRIGKKLEKNHVLRFELERSEKFGGFNDPKHNINLTNEHLLRAMINVEKDFKWGRAIPYAFVGAGYQWVSGDYDNNLIGNAGLGLKLPIYKALNLFAEVRAIRDFGNNDNYYGWLSGLGFAFGATPEQPKVVDSDGDGVADSLDKCPNTPANVKVDANGCPVDSDGDGVADYLDTCPNTPANVKVNANGCPIDSDGDGVADYLDKCPNTPANAKVDANGCPVDSDGDGVADYLDKCPNTPSGMKVNNVGCPVSFNFEVQFDCCKAEIKPQYMERIRKFAEFLKQNPGYKAEIQGYTDNTGSKEYNILLSQRRAKAVYDALIKLGVPKDRLTWAGYGPANPIAPNDTPEGRAKNRRVVAKLFY